MIDGKASIIGWAYTDFLGNSYDAWFHLLDLDGQAVSAPVLLSAADNGLRPLVGDLVYREGEFLAGYRKVHSSASIPEEIRLRRIDASGALASPEFVVFRGVPGQSLYGPWIERLGVTLGAAWMDRSASSLMVAMADPQGNLLVSPASYVTSLRGGEPRISGFSRFDDRFALTFYELGPTAVQPLETMQFDDQGLVVQGRSTLLDEAFVTSYYTTTASPSGLATSYVDGYNAPGGVGLRIRHDSKEDVLDALSVALANPTPGYSVEPPKLSMSPRGVSGVVWEEDRSFPTSKIFFVTAPPYAVWVGGAGPSPSAVAEARVLQPDSAGAMVAAIRPYGTSGYGCEVGDGDVNGDGVSDVLTGPGPGDTFGPQVRAFQWTGQTIAKVNFFAYGTLKFGVKARSGQMDGDLYDEILVGPGPGAVFGPHVRGFDFDNASVRAMPRLSFYAFGTLRYGVNAVAGDVDLDGFAEVLAGPGPGETFGAQLRGFDYDGAFVSVMTKINAFVFPSSTHGLVTASGNTDGDRYAEIGAAQGPSAPFGSDVAVLDYDGASLAGKAGSPFQPFPGPTTGAHVCFGQWMDADVREEIFTSRGPSPASISEVRVADDALAGFAALASYDPYPAGTHGTPLAMLDLGF